MPRSPASTHAIEDSVAEHERPKATRYATHLFLTTYAITHDAKTQELVIHGLLDEIVDGYFDAVESLDDEIEAIEDILFDENPKVANELQRRTFALRKSLVPARRAILPMREVVNTAMRRAIEDDRNAELAPYYEDLYDHVLRAAEWTESLRDIISSIFETNLSLADARMNAVMKKLTSWAAITGFFGQNVPYPIGVSPQTSTITVRGNEPLLGQYATVRVTTFGSWTTVDEVVAYSFVG